MRLAAYVGGAFGGQRRSAEVVTCKDLSDNGDVVGTRFPGEAWHMDRTTGQITLLEPPAGYSEIQAWAVNDAGIIVGDSYNPASESSVPTVWAPPTCQPVTLDLVGAESGSADDIDSDGTVVGTLWHSDGTGTVATGNQGPSKATRYLSTTSSSPPSPASTTAWSSSGARSGTSLPAPLTSSTRRTRTSPQLTAPTSPANSGSNNPTAASRATWPAGTAPPTTDAPAPRRNPRSTARAASEPSALMLGLCLRSRHGGHHTVGVQVPKARPGAEELASADRAAGR